MQEVLDILLERLPPPPLAAGQQRSIDKYKETREQIVSAVIDARQGSGNGMGSADFERWLDALAALRDTDPARFKDYADRLTALLAPSSDTASEVLGPTTSG